MTTLRTGANRRSFPAAVAHYVKEHDQGLSRLARAARVPLVKLRAVVDETGQPPDARLIEAVASVLGVPHQEFADYRLAVALEWLAMHPVPLHQLFLESQATIERDNVSDADFSKEPLAPTIVSLLDKQEMTQQELAESIGLAQTSLSRLLDGHDPASLELLDAIAQALHVAPEFFFEYRLALLAGWLAERPQRVDVLYDEAAVEPRLDEYAAWPIRELPPPDAVAPRALIESLLEIIGVEGPVLAARVYELRLEAAGLSETRDLSSLLNRATAAAERVNLIVATNDTGEEPQKYRTLRLPSSPKVVLRTLGSRRLSQVPRSELTALVRSTMAWKERRSIMDIQRAIVDIYRLRSVSPADVEHVNRCINNSWRAAGEE